MGFGAGGINWAIVQTGVGTIEDGVHFYACQELDFFIDVMAYCATVCLQSGDDNTHRYRVSYADQSITDKRVAGPLQEQVSITHC